MKWLKNTGFSAVLISLLLSSVLLPLGGCMVGPDYKKPKVDVPDAYRGSTKTETEAESLGNEKWWEVFKDPVLQNLIRTAIEQNYDVKIAAARILQAQAQLGITKADQYPTISAGANVTSERSSQSGPISAFSITQEEVGLSGSWTLDFWGQYRRATEAAKADLLASEWARQEVISTLVANVAASYFQLRELDLELEISKRTLSTRQESLKLTNLLETRGFNSMLDVRQSEQLVYTASTQVPDLERRIAQEENFLSTLLGKNPGDIPRGLTLTEEPHAPEVPAGIPSVLLARRPDIRKSEASLIAANARIGVAKAAYFPQISLTGSAGFQSEELSDLFTGPAGIWSVVGALAQPIFEAGRIRSGVKLAEAQKQEMLLTYKRTIQNAFRDVSDALVAYGKNREFRIEQEKLKDAAQDSARLSNLRFKSGETDYLEVLTNETNYFSAELGLAQAQLNELLSLVEVYRALGGGWEEHSS
jgi:outer membrane protein, multidrug efflux system